MKYKNDDNVKNGKLNISDLTRRNSMILTGTFLAIFVLTLAAVSFISSYSLQKELYSSASENLNLSSNYFNLELQNGMQLSKFTTSDASISKMAETQVKDFQKYYLGMKEIESLKKMNTSVASIYIYNGNLDTFFLSNEVPGSDNLIMKADSFSDTGLISMFENYSDYYPYTYYSRKVVFSDGTEDFYFTILGYERFIDVEDGKLMNATVINLDMSWIKDISLDSSDFFLIADSSGQTLSDNDVIPAFTDLSGEKFMKEALSSKEAGYTSMKYHGQKFIVAYTAPDSRNWRYFYFISAASINRNITILWELIAATAAVLALLYLLSFSRINQSINKPITDLASEYRKVESSLSSVQNQKQQEEHAELLNSLLDPRQNDRTAIYQKLKDKYSFSFPYQAGYRMLLFKVFDYQEIRERYNLEEQQIIIYAIGNMLKELLSKYFIVEFTEMKDTSGYEAFIALENGGFPSYEEVNNAFQEIYATLMEYSKHTIIACMSRESYDITEAANLHYTNINSITYHFLVGPETVLNSSDYLRHTENTAPFSEKMLRDLDRMLQNGNVEEACAFIRSILQSVLDKHIYTISMYVTRLNLALYGYTANPDILQYLVEQNSDFKEFRSISLYKVRSLEELYERFDQPIRTICNYYKQQKSSKAQNLIEQMNTMIDNQLSNPALSNESLAGELGFSTDYISRIYKKQTGKTILQVITERKMEKACLLLTTSNLSIQEIADACGYSNQSYFYKVFKKEIGMTPLEYKKQGRN